MKQRWQWSVPANLLVAGEYAITSPGGVGVAVAVEPRAVATVFVEDRSTPPGADLVRRPGEIVARTGGGIERIYPDAGHHLAESIMAHVVAPAQEGPRTSDEPGPQWRIEIDTSAFFDGRTGKKQGLGSSAAAAVLLTSALFQLTGRDPVHARDAVVRSAITAHRTAHGGRGSGYDIATSTLGGVIRFMGGPEPEWHPSACAHQWAAHDVQVFSWFSGMSVASSDAVARFDRYIPQDSEERTALIARNNAVVDRIERSTNWDELFRAISDARTLGEEIGASVGVPAEIDICQPHRDDGWVVKASGAGNERAIILAQPSPRRAVPRRATTLPMSTQGLRCDYDADRDGAQ
ncbi:MAG: hypothetical protein ACOCYB_04895 [Alkalispirochaeta sp.]